MKPLITSESSYPGSAMTKSTNSPT